MKMNNIKMITSVCLYRHGLDHRPRALALTYDNDLYYSVLPGDDDAYTRVFQHAWEIFTPTIPISENDPIKMISATDAINSQIQSPHYLIYTTTIHVLRQSGTLLEYRCSLPQTLEEQWVLAASPATS